MSKLADSDPVDQNAAPGPREKSLRRALQIAAGNLTPEQVAQEIDTAKRADANAPKREHAARISRARTRRGDGAAQLEEQRDAAAAEARQRAGLRQGGAAKAKQWTRKRSRVVDRARRAHMRDVDRAAKQAERMAEQALRDHGIRGHYRPIVKVAFFSAYLAGLDHNGALAMATLKTINMPRARVAAVLESALNPRPYQPRRDVCSGKRENQKRFALREGPRVARVGPHWEDGRRLPSHPQAIRTIQAAVFEWLSRSRTPRRGFTYVVRGFGRGLFASICRCGTETLFGHEDGMPGAVLALRLGGFHQYGQPPAEVCEPRDVGPTGHAYNVFWFARDAAEQRTDEFFGMLAQWARLPLIHKLAHDDPHAIEVMLARGPPDVVPVPAPAAPV